MMQEEGLKMNAIYCITNKVNGKMYVGKSIHVRTRIAQHFKPQSHCIGLARAINKHGKENFIWDILLDEVPDELVNDAESFFIWQHQSLAPRGYNLTGGGEGFDRDGVRLRSQNPEWKRKMAEKNKAMARDPKWIARNKEQSSDPTWKANHAEGLKKRSRNPEWISKVGKGPNGGSKTFENIANLTAANRKKAKDPIWLKINSDASRYKRGKPVVCIEMGRVFLCIRDAMRETGIADTSILTVCKGNKRRKSAGGYHWRYATQEESESARRVV